VRQNLGITFAKVESRPVSRTLRLPGAFELIPSATRQYHAAAEGRIEVLVDQYESVEAGALLARIDSPRLRDLQQQLADAAAAVALARAVVDSMPAFFAAHEKHHLEIERSVQVWAGRVQQLDDLRRAGGGQATESADASAQLAQARANFAETLEKEAELGARKVEADARLAAAKQKHDLLASTLASLVAIAVEELLRESDESIPRWQRIDTIDIRAAVPGVVHEIVESSGAYVDPESHLLTVIAPDQLRFRARGYQSDLGRLADGLPARIVAPAGIGIDDSVPMTGAILIAPTASAGARTVDVVVKPERVDSWARGGVSGFLEITLEGAGRNELAIPAACVVRDGLTPVIFRRDPRDPDKVIRMEADLGADDGRWIEIKSGVAQGNEVVLDGVYQLLVATSGSIQKGGHFHPDGTFHEGTD
jgi:multidrug efflux pump subunit AcrA (membrane-fusion protein)